MHIHTLKSTHIQTQKKSTQVETPFVQTAMINNPPPHTHTHTVYTHTHTHTNTVSQADQGQREGRFEPFNKMSC